MERDVEKSTLDALALASVIGLLTSAAGSISGTPWQFTAYFSIVGALFDIIFTYDFFMRLQKNKTGFPLIAFLSSVLPLTFVSGPFLAGWTFNDLSSAAVRGFWLGSPPANGLAVLVALRLLRVTRPFWIPAGDTVLCGRSWPLGYRAVALAGIMVMLAGAFASDAMLLPGPASTFQAHRTVAISRIAGAKDDATRVSEALAAEALALQVLGRPLLSAPSELFPAEYTVEVFEGIEAWFPVHDERKARGVASAIVSLASLAATMLYAVACRNKDRRRSKSGQESSDERNLNIEGGSKKYRNRHRDVPAGTAELTGILGKHPH